MFTHCDCKDVVITEGIFGEICIAGIYSNLKKLGFCDNDNDVIEDVIDS